MGTDKWNDLERLATLHGVRFSARMRLVVIRYHRTERTIAVWAPSRHGYALSDAFLMRMGAMGTGAPPVGRPRASRGQRKSVHRVDDAVNVC